MKALAALNNVEKAKLLHSLFPDEIPGIIQFTNNMCATIKENETQQREHWKNGLFGFDFWLSLLRSVETNIGKYGNKLEKSSGLFADQLFDGYNAMFTVHCLLVYTTQSKLPNTKLAKAVDLLFNP